MKILIRFLLLAVLLLNMAACKKESTSPAGNVVYEENVPGILKNEPVLLTFANSNNTEKVSWSVTPSAGTSISTVGNNATITFSKADTYVVVATAGAISARYNVTVINVEYVDYGTAFTLFAPKLVNINEGEELTFSVHNAQAGSNISWIVSNQAFPVSIDAAKQTAAVVFTRGGLCTITASDGMHTQRRTVWVNDPLNTNNAQDTVPFILGEKLTLTPFVETIGATRQLVLRAGTVNSYHCSTDNILSFSVNNEYMIDYAGVAISPQPCTVPGVATASNSFSNMPAGTHDFTINFGNKTYTGSVTLSSSGVYSFAWPDNGAVNINPLTVQ